VKAADAVTLRPVARADAAAIAAIYDPFVRESVVTFEEEPVDAATMADRIGTVTASFPWWVLCLDDDVVGYAYATTWRARSAARFVCETSIYLDARVRGRRLASGLYRALFDDLRARGIEVAMAAIALPNPASVALHERLGFVSVGLMPAVGWKLGRWVDLGFWQYRLGPRVNAAGQEAAGQKAAGQEAAELGSGG